MNVLYLLLNLFSLMFNKIDIECKYEEIDVIEYTYDDYKLIEREEDIEIVYKNERLEIIKCKDNYKVLYENDVLTIFYKLANNDYLHINKYSKGKITSEIIDNKFVNSFDVIIYKNNYLFVSSVIEYENDQLKKLKNQKEYLKERDAVILLIDFNLRLIECNIYGGELNDYFTRIHCNDYDETIFVSGVKDQNSGYDFGYGGNGVKGYFVIQINEQFDIIDLLVFDDSINNIEFKENIIIYTLYHIFLFDYDLKLISSLKLAQESIFGCKMFSNYYACFSPYNLKIYDYDKNVLIDSYDYSSLGGVNDVKIDGNYIYLKARDKLYKTIFFDNSLMDKQFIYDINEIDYYNLDVIGIPNNFKLKAIVYENGYDRSKFGVYNMLLDYGDFTICCCMKILERCNIVEGYIYPVGYQIKFSGQAYLNGVEINNNYAIEKEGEYELRLVGKTEEKIIKFKALVMDIEYKDVDLKYWHYELEKNQELSINIEYENECNIEQVIVNGESYHFNNDSDNNLLTIKFQNCDSGLYSYFVDKIVYNKNSEEFEEKINYLLIVKVLEDDLAIANNYYNDEDNFIFNTKIINGNNIRFIKVIKEDHLNNYTYIPLRNGDINLNQIVTENGIISFYLVYDVGGRLYEEKFLFQIEYDFSDSDNFAKMELIKEGSNLKEIKILIKNDERLKRINDKEHTIFFNEIKTDYTFVLASVLVVIILFGIYKTKKTIKKENAKRKKTSKSKNKNK